LGKGEGEAVEPGFGGDPLHGEFVGVEEGVRDSAVMRSALGGVERYYAKMNSRTCHWLKGQCAPSWALSQLAAMPQAYYLQRLSSTIQSVD
jgi:hypothetical protein